MPNKSQGPDQLHPKLIKETVNTMKELLCIIFNKSLQEEIHYYQMIGETQMLPQFSKGEKKKIKAENYRPISLTSVPGKRLEKSYENYLFSEVQRGFVKGKSCVTQLLEFIAEITEAIDNGDEIDVIYLDFCKAYDKVPHKRLLKRCRDTVLRVAA